MEKLKRDAESAMSAGPFSVMDKHATPPSGDNHDYMSLATYWWPNPAQPNGLPYIRRDGDHNPSCLEISDSGELEDMVSTVQTLALAYYLTGDEKFAARARMVIRTWFVDPATRMNSSMNYAQGIRGLNTGRGIGIVDAHPLTDVVDA